MACEMSEIYHCSCVDFWMKIHQQNAQPLYEPGTQEQTHDKVFYKLPKITHKQLMAAKITHKIELEFTEIFSESFLFVQRA